MTLIHIPPFWLNPRFRFGDRVRLDEPGREAIFTGIVLGMRYYTPLESESFGEWEYDILVSVSHGNWDIESGFEPYLTLLP